jgi:hypothetical protein
LKQSERSWINDCKDDRLIIAAGKTLGISSIFCLIPIALHFIFGVTIGAIGNWVPWVVSPIYFFLADMFAQKAALKEEGKPFDWGKSIVFTSIGVFCGFFFPAYVDFVSRAFDGTFSIIVKPLFLLATWVPMYNVSASSIACLKAFLCQDKHWREVGKAQWRELSGVNGYMFSTWFLRWVMYTASSGLFTDSNLVVLGIYVGDVIWTYYWSKAMHGKASAKTKVTFSLPARQAVSNREYPGNHSPLKDKMQESRFELKYAIPEDVALGIRDFISPIMQMDENSVGKPNYSYAVHSIYFDSDDLRTYIDTVDGNKNRFKLRARFYDDNPLSPVFLEIKRRIDRCILKQRGSVRREGPPGYIYRWGK